MQIYYSTLNEANRAVLESSEKVVGVMHFAKNFSAAFELRRDSTDHLAEENIEASEISIFLDMGGTYNYFQLY